MRDGNFLYRGSYRPFFIMDIFRGRHPDISLKVPVEGPEGAKTRFKGNIGDVASVVESSAGAFDAQTVDEVRKADIQAVIEYMGYIEFTQMQLFGKRIQRQRLFVIFYAVN